MQRMKSNYDITDPENDELIVSESMDNMFQIITKQETYSTLSQQKGRVLMMFNPLSGLPDVNQLIDTLIEYYSSEDIEMYERCTELVKIKKSGSKLVHADIFESEFDFDEEDWDSEDNDR
tara:strand:+ start:738 stop:1097 length:360 start_codon:yes stop_codon:yes gene_type:complete